MSRVLCQLSYAALRLPASASPLSESDRRHQPYHDGVPAGQRVYFSRAYPREDFSFIWPRRTGMSLVFSVASPEALRSPVFSHRRHPVLTSPDVENPCSAVTYL